MTKLLLLFLFYALGLLLSGLLLAGLMPVFLYCKKCFGHLESDEAWNVYFQSLSDQALLGRIFLLYTLSICIVAGMGCWILKALTFQYAPLLSLLLVAFGLGRTVLRYGKQREKLVEKINRLREHIE